MLIPIIALLTSFPVPQDDEPLVPSTDPARVARESAELALSEGRLEDASRHALRALEGAPFDPEVLRLALRAAAGDEDSKLLFTHDYVDAVMATNGRVSLNSVKGDLADSTQAVAIATARAGAVSELLDFAEAAEKGARRRPDELLVANYARRLALDLASESPALLSEYGKRLSPVHAVSDSYYKGVLDDLERAMNRALSSGEVGLAMRAGRVLHGLAVQGDFKDLQGPVPRGMGPVRAAAGKGLSRARELVARDVGDPWTVEDLEWLDSEEGEAFTRQHRSFALPGVAVSPLEWYRVETDCGFETLLGVASTIEDHHRRLAGWYGQDPFVDIPGTVRIVPESSGLESEGSPFWWAGGFQSGNLTVMRFAQGNIEGLGHGLTHELTHRFDGAIYPGQPAWLTEGKAVWTASAYGHSTDKKFVPNHVNFGTIQGVFIEGWSGAGKLKKLLEGEPEDYRDNYSVGYSLYVYLNTWEANGKRLFQDRLRKFMEEGDETSKHAFAFFEECFLDGQEGRPADYDAFIEGWSEFLRGFYWKTPAEWTKRYTSKTPPSGNNPWVYDEPTWTWQRSRSEPWFGQDQARLAGEVLLDAGKEDAAVRAYIWSLAVDGREPRSLRALANILPGLKRERSAWVTQHSLRFPLWAVEEPAPFVDKLDRTVALLEAQSAAVHAYREAGHSLAAAAIAADHDRLARWLGLPELGPGEGKDTLRHSFDPAPRPLASEDWVEDKLVGYDEDRSPGLWFAADNGDLHVGRRKPREGSGRFDRGGGGVAFARSQEYQLPGTYRLKTRIQVTTAHASGAVVIGYQRRDLAMRCTFSLGDYMYAVGESEDEPSFDSMGWGLSGLWERDGSLGGSNRGGRYAFDVPSTSFELELLVDGASMQAFLNGKHVGTYHTADGRPIEGQFGFATSRGAIRVHRPVVERLERSRLAARERLAPEGLDLKRGVSPMFGFLENKPLHGWVPAPNGTLVLWVSHMATETDSGSSFEAADVIRRASSAARRVAKAARKDDVTQPIRVALPTRLDGDDLLDLAAELEEEFDGFDFEVVMHPFGGYDSPDEGKRWLLFVDASGVVRVCQPYVAVSDGFPGRLGHWLTVFRDNGAPPRDLPPVERPPAEDEEDE